MQFGSVPMALDGCDPVLSGGAPGLPNANGWLADATGPNGEFVFDTVHGVQVVTSAASPAYLHIISANGKTPPAQTYIASSFTDSAVGLFGPKVGWEIFLNHVDYVYPNAWSDQPPSELEWSGSGVRLHVDVVAHELMHVVGAGHDPSGWGTYLSAVHWGTDQNVPGPFAHLNLEANARLFNLTSGSEDPLPGIYRLPHADQAFLGDKYYAGTYFDSVRMHSWNLWYDHGGYRNVPVGASASETLPLVVYPVYELGPFEAYTCSPTSPIQPFSATDIAHLKAALPDFTAADAADLEVSFGVIPYCPGGSYYFAELDIDGTSSVHVPADGVWSDDPVTWSLSATNIAGDIGTGPIFYTTAQVVATIKDTTSTPALVLWDHVPLRAFVEIASCGQQ